MPINVSGYTITSGSVKSYPYDVINRRGLILHYDASIVESYPESGTTWNDLSQKVENVDVLVVGGGGAGGHNGTNNDIAGGGGGAGGLVYQTNYKIDSSTGITVTVGDGGTGAPTAGGTTKPTNGGNSVFGTITAIGGGAGGGYVTSPSAYYAPNTGGSGGGGMYSINAGASGTSLQGNSGGTGTSASTGGAYAGGGGGGAGATGGNGYGNGGNGGVGLQYDITGIPTYYAGGGGGGAGYQITGFSGGTGGLGGGGNASSTGIGSPGTTNTGGGAGGSGNVSGPPYPGAASANGGSGIVVVRYKGKPKATGGTITQHNNYTVHTFTSSGTFTPTAKQNATLLNGPTFSNGRIILDGTNDWISLPTTGFVSTSLTAEFWVKFNSTGNNAYLWCLADAVGNNPELRIAFTSLNKLQFYWYDNGTYLIGGSTSTATLSTNVWYHIVSTTINNQYIFYINGSVDTSFTGTTYDGGTIVAHSIGTYNLYGTSPGYSGYLNMSIGVFRFYNRVLTASEVLSNYNIEKGRFV